MKRKYTVRFALFALITAIAIQPSSPLYADQNFYNSNDILFYNRDALCGTGEGAEIGGGNLPAETIKRLDSDKVKELAEQNKERYTYAEEKSGVPWQVLAGVHYREARMDPTKSLSDGSKLGTGVNVDGINVVADAKEDAANMAELFKSMAQYVYKIDINKDSAKTLTTEQWGQAYLAYNRGVLYKDKGRTYDQSPYVMNGFDEKHMNMSWIDADTVRGVDGNIGALSVLTYLGGPVGSAGSTTDGGVGYCNTSSGIVTGNLVKTALGLALTKPAEVGMTKPEQATQQYRDAIKKYNKTPAQYPEITDCGRFVSTVFRASGVDPNFAEVYVPTQIDYMNSSSKFKAMGKLTMNEMQPGDVIATPGHIMLFTGENNGNYAVDASYHERVPSVRTSGSIQWMLDRDAEVWRLK